MVNWQLSSRIATDQYHMNISRAHVSTHGGDVIYLEAVRWPVNCFTRSRSMFNLTISSYFGSTADNAHLLDINVVINWQLSKQGIRWPVSLELIAGWGVDSSKSSIFEVIRWQVTSIQIIAGSSLLFLKFIWNMLCLCATQLRFWFQTDRGSENSASYYRQGRQLLLTLLAMVTRWSRSTSNFYALIGKKFDRWVHAENLCSILNLAYFSVNLWCI